MADLVVYTFSPAWGLSSSSPFALKLIKWLEIAGLPFQQKFADNPSKGPKGKNPWIEVDGKRIGDTEIIISLLIKQSGFDIEAELSLEQKAISHTIRRMLEEHLHQVLEWELFMHPAGYTGMREMLATMAPAFIVAPLLAMMRRHFAKQLHARGIARHSDAVIAEKGKADVDAFEALLGRKPFLFGEHPSMADVTAFGLIAPLARWPMRTPVADYVKTRAKLVDYIERIDKFGAKARGSA